MDAATLKELASRGWLIGPDENEDTFLARVSSHPDRTSTSHLLQRMEETFGMVPGWVDVHYSNRGLALWEGAVVTIEGHHLQIQLRKAFQKKKRFLFYSGEEILAHEAVHAARMAFVEPLFEEILAYQTSISPFRRYWGPFFRSAKESRLWMLLIFATLGSSLFFPIFNYLWIGCGFLFMYGAMRLICLQKQFRKCLKQLTVLGNSSKQALKMMLCLTDKEIREFAQSPSSEACLTLFIQKKNSSLRWSQIASVANLGVANVKTSQ